MERFSKPDTYAVWSKNKDIRFNSTSGGAFSEFAKVILADGGVVAGARYNDDNLVEHAIVDDYAGVEELRQSKYLSSSVGDVYIHVKKALAEGRLVAFCGAPCQVAGLYSFLGKEYDNLFTMDFICRGMNSPKAFKSWLNEVEKQENSKATKVWFKYKDGGWKTSPKRARVDFEYELQMAQTNRIMAPDIDTIFLTTSLEYAYLSSSTVKEVAYYHGDISRFVQDVVEESIAKKMR